MLFTSKRNVRTDEHDQTSLIGWYSTYIRNSIVVVLWVISNQVQFYEFLSLLLGFTSNLWCESKDIRFIYNLA